MNTKNSPKVLTPKTLGNKSELIVLFLLIIAVLVSVVSIAYQPDVASTAAAIVAVINICVSMVPKISEFTAKRPRIFRKTSKFYILSGVISTMVILAGVIFLASTLYVNAKVSEGKTYLNTREYPKAASAFQEADQWDRLPQTRADILLGLAEIFVEQGKYDLALDKMVIYDHELAGNDVNKDAKALELKGRIYFAQGKSKIAIDFFKPALEKWDNNHAVLKAFTENYIAGVYLLTGNYSLAMLELKEAQKIFDDSEYIPGQAITNVNMGMVNISLGNIQLAKKQIETAQSLYTQVSSDTGIAICNLDLGYLFWLNHDYQIAEQYFTKALPVFIANGMLSMEIETYIGLGNSAVGRGQYAVGKEYYDKALLMSEEINYQHGISLAMANLGGYYIKADMQSQALKQYMEAVGIAIEADNQPLIADIKSDMGLLYQQMGVYSMADELLSEAVTIYKILDQKESLAIAYLNQARIRRNQQQNIDSLKLLQQAKEIFEALPNSLEKAIVYRELANLALLMPNESGTPEFYFDKAIKIAESLEDQRVLALINEDRCMIMSTSVLGVLNCLDDVASIYRSIGDSVGQAKINYQKGIIYLNTGDLDLAEKCFTDTRIAYEDKGMIRQQGQALAKLGEVAQKKGDLDGARINYEAARSLFENADFSHDVAVTDINIAAIFQAKGEYGKAEHLLSQAQVTLDFDKDYINNTLALNALAFVEFLQGKYNQALANYDKALQVARQINDIERVVIVLTNYGRCYLALNDLPNAQEKQEEALRNILAIPFPPVELEIVVKTNLGEVYIWQNKPDQAETLLQEALKMAESKYPMRVQRIKDLLQKIGNK